MTDEELLAVALDCAREAAALVHKAWRTRPSVELKGRVELVTQWDKASEALLRARLEKETPHAVVGEELGGESADVTWFVDPIDGTTNFVHGHPFYCVSVGLVRGKQPVLGAIVAPALATEWTGIAGKFATRSGAPCRVSGVAHFHDALLATGFPYDRTQPDNNFDAFVAIKKKCQAVRRCGAAALDLCLVADGTYDGYWERKLKAWDLAAGAAIVAGAGGRVSAYDGGPVDLRAGHVLASNGAIHDALIDALANVAPSSTKP
jgi:myo-inositol-1(or 4)-monophosphatase